jgi:hypothetical protein
MRGEGWKLDDRASIVSASVGGDRERVVRTTRERERERESERDPLSLVLGRSAADAPTERYVRVVGE